MFCLWSNKAAKIINILQRWAKKTLFCLVCGLNCLTRPLIWKGQSRHFVMDVKRDIVHHLSKHIFKAFYRVPQMDFAVKQFFNKTPPALWNALKYLTKEIPFGTHLFWRKWPNQSSLLNTFFSNFWNICSIVTPFHHIRHKNT